jgi:hypothetical protein
MIKLIDILREAKQVGPLYHFTNISFLNDILKTGLKFKPDNSGLPQYKNTFNVAVTRDKSGEGVMKYLSFKREFNIRIKLDGDKVSEQYKVEPINVENIWNYDIGDKNSEEQIPTKFPYFFEERIISNKPGYLSPSYISQIDTIVPEENLDDEFIGKINIINKF